MMSHFALVVAVAFSAAVAALISYDGGKSIDIRSAVSIVLLVAVASPIAAFVGELSDKGLPSFAIPDGEEMTPEYEEVALDAFCEGIGELLAERYSLDKSCFAVKAENFDFTKMRAEKIYVTLYGRAVLCDPDAIERLVNEYGLGECYAECGI